MSALAIHVDKLGKQYRLGVRGPNYSTIRETVSNAVTAPFRRLRRRARAGEAGSRERPKFWALRDISFDVRRGEVVGIIGHNGAGKSTLLKILSRITHPTEGFATIRGRVGPLLEVGTGFHPELSGRDNIFMNGAILGMRRTEIQRKFDEIVAFAEVDDFIDTAVKHYSSGMYLRLAFAVAAHLEPEILVIDEVLAVGDASFQKKCLGKMGEVSSQGRTVIFVSHNLEAITTLCERGILLDRGQVRQIGTAREVVDAYLAQVDVETESGEAEFAFDENPSLPAQILNVAIADQEGRPKLRFDVMTPVRVTLRFAVRKSYPNLIASCQVLRSDGHAVFLTYDVDHENTDRETRRGISPREAGVYEASFELPAPLLNTGQYELLLNLFIPRGPKQDVQRGIRFQISDLEGGSFASFPTKRRRPGLLTVPIKWDVTRLKTDE